MQDEMQDKKWIAWQKDDMRLLAEGRKVIAMQRRFQDQLGQEMWRDSPNWHAELLAQALIDCKVLEKLDDYRPTLARIKELEDRLRWLSKWAESVEPTLRSSIDGLRRLTQLEDKVETIVSDLRGALTALREYVKGIDHGFEKVAGKLKKLKRRVSAIEDVLDIPK